MGVGGVFFSSFLLLTFSISIGEGLVVVVVVVTVERACKTKIR